MLEIEPGWTWLHLEDFNEADRRTAVLLAVYNESTGA
jgi:hypothetical protein